MFYFEISPFQQIALHKIELSLCIVLIADG